MMYDDGPSSPAALKFEPIGSEPIVNIKEEPVDNVDQLILPPPQLSQGNGFRGTSSVSKK